MKKLPVLLAAALLTLTAAACTPDTSASETDSGTRGESVTVESLTDAVATDTPTENETPPAADSETFPAETEPEKETASIVYNDLNDLQKMTTPFWKLDTMHRENTCMILREDGSITAKLAFMPTRILAVEDNSLTKVYEEGKDYTWDGASNTLVWKEGSSISYFTQNDIEGKDENGTPLKGFDGTFDELGRSRFGNALYCVGEFLYAKQIHVTYEYAPGSWTGEMTPYQGETLDRTTAKLKAGETVTVFFYGDSIFTGCDSSGMYDRPPYQDSFPTFTKQVLEERFGGRVKLYNPSVGGKTSQWGAENAQTLICDRSEPDLVIIGFGMNDADSSRASAKNVKSIIETVRAQYPDCEFIVVTPMVPNAAGGFLTVQHQLSTTYGQLVKSIEGVAFVDMFACHTTLLETKDFISMSGNNINHPNDWLIRVYAMQILSALVDY